ncbi:serine kinase, partial [candidate division KSB1 bacterium]|nr:serine kinase [candidate division KSB1 bacterium]
MLLNEIVQNLSLKILSGEENLQKSITCGHISDILSDVMARAVKGSIWITNQTHENIIAICYFKSLGAVILPGGLDPDQSALQKAREKNIPVLST